MSTSYFGDNHFVDWSHLLSAPAGSKGRVVPNGDKLIFDRSKTEARFWGVNIVGGDCFPSKEDAERIASRLIKMGCNLVRFHHMDAPWATPNIFGNLPSTLVLSQVDLDRLDYFFYCLKKKGIYSFFDLLVHRSFNRLDGVDFEVPEGGKQAAFFDTNIIELQKKFAEQLLTHFNKYTSLRYSQEAALVGCLIINEASILTTTTGNQLSKEHYQELNREKPRNFLRRSKLPVFEVDYSFPGGKIISLNGKNFRLRDLDYLINKEKSFFDSMKSFIKNKLKFEGLIIGSNMPTPMANVLYTNKDMDAIATNAYWDHPQLEIVGFDWERVKEAPVSNKSQLAPSDYFFNNLVQLISRFKLKSKPLFVTEWNSCRPNKYAIEALPFVAAYGSLQGWNALCQFSFESPLKSSHAYSPFNVADDKLLMAQWSVAAPLFLRGDVSEALSEAVFTFSNKESFKFNDTIDKDPLLPFHSKVSYTFEDEEKLTAQNYQRLPLSVGSPVIADFENGRMEIRTKTTIGVVGSVYGETFDFPYFQIQPDYGFVSVLITTYHGKDIGEDHRMVIAVVKAEEGVCSNTKILFKHAFESKRILVQPKYLDGDAEDYIELQAQSNGMMLNMNSEMKYGNGHKVASAMVFEVLIER